MSRTACLPYCCHSSLLWRSALKQKELLLGLFGPEDEVTMVFRNIGRFRLQNVYGRSCCGGSDVSRLTAMLTQAITC
jgi:hypothetical protein